MEEYKPPFGLVILHLALHTRSQLRGTALDVPDGCVAPRLGTTVEVGSKINERVPEACDSSIEWLDMVNKLPS